jgi:hypothetical protein
MPLASVRIVIEVPPTVADAVTTSGDGVGLGAVAVWVPAELPLLPPHPTLKATTTANKPAAALDTMRMTTPYGSSDVTSTVTVYRTGLQRHC